MTDEKQNEPRMPLPGVAAICLYLLLVAGTIVLGVVAKHVYPPLFLLFSVVFVTASAGMIASFRWAWSLGVAAVFLMTCYWAWIFSTTHSVPAGVQGALNLLFFLYLVRPEVRARLR